MEFEWLPKELINLCNSIILKHHKLHGGSLPKILWHLDTLVFSVVHSDLRTLTLAASSAVKSMIAAGVVAVVAAVLGAVVNWWFAVAVIPAAMVIVYFKRRADEFSTLQGAIILAIEFLGDNVTGSAERYPAAALKAKSVLDKFLPDDRTRLLDIYLPRRAELPRDLLAAL